jgi:hypothetical protein
MDILTSMAASLLGWTPVSNLSQICEDSWGWQSKTPKGFD